jgi:phosphoglycolate phosphatase
MNEKKYTHLMWDFNGTIFDDAEAGIKSVNKMLSERGLDTIKSRERYREIFDFPIEEYYRSLGFDFDKEPYDVLAPIWVALYNENAESAGLCEGVRETMEEVRSLGIEQSVLSACEIGMLRRYLKRLGVDRYISEVMGLDNIHARSKLALAHEWIARNEGAKVLMIGDTTHDYETAMALGADCVLYSGGHQSREKLERCGCPVIDNIGDVVGFLKQIIFVAR